MSNPSSALQGTENTLWLKCLCAGRSTAIWNGSFCELHCSCSFDLVNTLDVIFEEPLMSNKREREKEAKFTLDCEAASYSRKLSAIAFCKLSDT